MAKKGKKGGDDNFDFVDDMVFCSFCGRLRQEVNQLIEGPDGILICDECVEVCHRLMNDAELANTATEVDKSKELIPSEELPVPESIKQVLDEYVIGQDEAKKVLSPISPNAIETEIIKI